MVGDAEVFCKVSVCGLDGEGNRRSACSTPAGNRADRATGYETTLYSYKSQLTSLSHAVLLFARINRFLRSVGNKMNNFSELLQKQPKDSTP